MVAQLLPLWRIFELLLFFDVVFFVQYLKSKNKAINDFWSDYNVEFSPKITSSSSTSSSSPTTSFGYGSSAFVSGGANNPLMMTGPLPHVNLNLTGPSGNSRFDWTTRCSPIFNIAMGIVMGPFTEGVSTC